MQEQSTRMAESAPQKKRAPRAVTEGKTPLTSGKEDSQEHETLTTLPRGQGVQPQALGCNSGAVLV